MYSTNVYIPHIHNIHTSYISYRLDPQPRRILVTGAASGLGREVCRACSRRGDFIIGMDVDTQGLKALQEEIGPLNEESLFVFVCLAFWSEESVFL